VERVGIKRIVTEECAVIIPMPRDTNARVERPA
jgi:hypothetical protein